MITDKLTILLLSGVNPYIDSGIWAYDIYKSLNQKGHKVLLLTKNYDERFEPGIESIYEKNKWKSVRGNWEWFYEIFKRKIQYFMNKNIKTDPAYYMTKLNESASHIPIAAIMSHIRSKVDIIIYLFPHGFLDSKNLYELNRKTRAPVFVMPVDMASFTGGCHYANCCENYKHSCGHCPGLYSTKAKDATYRNLLFKKKYIDKMEAYTLSNTWTSEHIKQSALYKNKLNFNIDVVIDETHYQPCDRSAAKKNFSIPSDKKIIFFGASYLEDKRKGLLFLVKALTQLYEELSEKERDQIGIAIAGRINTELEQLFPFKIYQLGHLSHSQLPVAFQMSDVFVSPSIQDAGPMMVIQSMMCGTPVVAFEMGNAIDFIINGETGYMAQLYNIEQLKEGIRLFINKTTEEKQYVSDKCRNMALSKSSYTVFATRIEAIYSNLRAVKGETKYELVDKIKRSVPLLFTIKERLIPND